MRFTYTYRSSDGQRHTAEIDAADRDAAFAAIRREMGVKPIKVMVADAEGGEARAQARRRWGVKYAIAVALAIVLACVAWWWIRHGGPSGQYTVMTPQGPVTYSMATPLQRQMIPGDRARIDAARETAFRSPAETHLARFAEPGRAVRRAGRAVGKDFEECLKKPLRIASTDFTEVVDLKRIVTGMKREMKAYLDGGGTVEGYLAELEKRQRLEVSYREHAERRLSEILSSNSPKDAYAYWLKANASLKSMGIYELPIPDSLRGYQAGLDLD